MQAKSIGFATGWMNTVDGVYLLVSIAAAINRKQNHAEALDTLREAWTVLELIKSTMTPVGATVCKGIADTLGRLKRSEEGMEYYAKSMSICERVGTVETIPFATLLEKYGEAEIQLGRVQEGRQKLRRSSSVLMRLDMPDKARGIQEKLKELQ